MTLADFELKATLNYCSTSGQIKSVGLSSEMILARLLDMMTPQRSGEVNVNYPKLPPAATNSLKLSLSRSCKGPKLSAFGDSRAHVVRSRQGRIVVQQLWGRWLTGRYNSPLSGCFVARTKIVLDVE